MSTQNVFFPSVGFVTVHCCKSSAEVYSWSTRSQKFKSQPRSFQWLETCQSNCCPVRPLTFWDQRWDLSAQYQYTMTGRESKFDLQFLFYHRIATHTSVQWDLSMKYPCCLAYDQDDNQPKTKLFQRTVSVLAENLTCLYTSQILNYQQPWTVC